MIRKHTQTEHTRWHRWQLGHLDLKKKRRADRDGRREKKRAARATRQGDRISLTVTVVTIVLSIGVAIPSQFDWFLAKLAHDTWADPNAWRAVAMTLLVEVLCWLCAILYARTVRDHPVKIYRVGTFVFAGTAAWINYDHGRELNPTIGVVSALGSLMGVGAFELYMHRARHDASGMTIVEVRLWALRWRKHPLVMREASRIVATFGLAVPREVAFRMAYLRKIGNPTLPVAITSPRLAGLPGVEPKPELPKRKRGAALAAEATVELPVDWSCPDTIAELTGETWPTPGPELGGTAVAAPERKPEPPRDRQTQAPSSGPSSSASATKPSSAPVPTSAVPSSGDGRKPSRSVLSGLVRKSPSSDRIQFEPTSAELTGSGAAIARIGQYLARAEAEGQSLAALDRGYIAAQFKVSTKQVRNSVTAYKETKK